MAGRVSKGLAVWGVEATSAVLMILCNKALMTGAWAFRYPTTLTAAHFAWTAVGSSIVTACASSGSSDKVQLPPWHVVGAFVLLSSVAIILSNASLLLNSVAFYQMMKLATLPFVAGLEWAAQTKTFTCWHPVFYAVILAGVALTIVGDVIATPLGTVVASVSFMSAGLHQFFCGQLQAHYGLSPSKLLAVVSPFKAVLLFAVGPVLDGIWFGSWIQNYRWAVPSALLVLGTCLLAISLNLAQYSVINLLGAGMYQALSQLKTVSVVVLGSIYFQGRVDLQQLAGTVITLTAVIGLARFEQGLAAVLTVEQHQDEEDGQPLLKNFAPSKH